MDMAPFLMKRGSLTKLLRDDFGDYRRYGLNIFALSALENVTARAIVIAPSASLHSPTQKSFVIVPNIACTR